MSLVGRDVEQARVQRLLADARAERSAVLGLRGAPGIRKSVLLDHAVSIAEAAGMRVVRGAGIESDHELAYGGLHQLLFPHLDRLDALPTPQATALRCAFGLAEGDDANRFLISAGTLSLLADLAMPHMATYGAQKAAVESFTRSWAAEWGQHGIRVNAVAPGNVTSDNVVDFIGADQFTSWSEVNPPKRNAAPEELAEVIAFVASERASFVTGQVIVADGGRLAV